jgi:major intracellular serine protease
MITKEIAKVVPYKIDSVQLEPEKIPENIKKVGAEFKWKQGYTGEGVIVAILDSGCDIAHPDLKDCIIGGYNFTDDSQEDSATFHDLNGHGTHIAGVIAAKKNKSGIVGVAPDAKLLIIKVLNEEGRGSVANLINGINYALDWVGPNGETVDVISLSLGVPNHSEELEEVVLRAVSRDIPVVVASGNNGDGNLETNEYSYPAAYEEVIAVGAVDQFSVLAYFSNTNDEVDLYAPGKEILSTYPEGSYASLSGTSMAAPHITGAIAVILQELRSTVGRENLSEPLIFKTLMQSTIKTVKEGISVLDLTEPTKNNMKSYQIRKDLLLKCFCETRKSQAFYTKCIDECSSDMERNFLIELAQESAKTSNRIQEYCRQI